MVVSCCDWCDVGGWFVWVEWIVFGCFVVVVDVMYCDCDVVDVVLLWEVCIVFVVCDCDWNLWVFYFCEEDWWWFFYFDEWEMCFELFGFVVCEFWLCLCVWDYWCDVW